MLGMGSLALLTVSTNHSAPHDGGEDVGREGDWVIKSRATTGVADSGAAPCHHTSDEFRHPLNPEPGFNEITACELWI